MYLGDVKNVEERKGGVCLYPYNLPASPQIPNLRYLSVLCVAETMKKRQEGAGPDTPCQSLVVPALQMTETPREMHPEKCDHFLEVERQREQ